jgi:hypothetical protein
MKNKVLQYKDGFISESTIIRRIVASYIASHNRKVPGVYIKKRANKHKRKDKQSINQRKASTRKHERSGKIES